MGELQSRIRRAPDRDLQAAVPNPSRRPLLDTAAADTDWKMRAQVLSYSRARGIFAGLELNGAVIRMDGESTRQFYGKIQPFATTLKTVSSPEAALPFLEDLAKWAKIASK